MGLAIVLELKVLFVVTRILNLVCFFTQQLLCLLKILQDQFVNLTHFLKLILLDRIGGGIRNTLLAHIGRAEQSQEIKMKVSSYGKHLALIKVVERQVIRTTFKLFQHIVCISDAYIRSSPNVGKTFLQIVIVILVTFCCTRTRIYIVLIEILSHTVGQSPQQVFSIQSSTCLQGTINSINGRFKSIGRLEQIVFHLLRFRTHVQEIVTRGKHDSSKQQCQTPSCMMYVEIFFIHIISVLFCH